MLMKYSEPLQIYFDFSGEPTSIPHYFIHLSIYQWPITITSLLDTMYLHFFPYIIYYISYPLSILYLNTFILFFLGYCTF